MLAADLNLRTGSRKNGLKYEWYFAHAITLRLEGLSEASRGITAAWLMSGFGDTTDNEGQVSKTRPPLFGGRRSTILLMVKSISRDWGRLDFLRKGSKLVFLEYNANGQFLFLDLKNEFGILDRVVEYLLES